tara:strand:- start:181 stop:528 length:348 start_codon:yes stop_codon:yes gene_type:complete
MSLIEKPWGSEYLIEANEKYVLKKLFMKAGHRCSLQYHEYKHETIYVISGVLVIKHGISLDTISTKTYNTGCTISIKPGEIHRMEALEDSVYLEASTPELDDVIRLQDDYIRSNL